MDYNKDYYKILEINKNSSNDEIKKSYRRLSKLHHPDINKNVDDKFFKEIASAYSILSDSKLKNEYDRRSPYGKNYQPNPFGNMFGNSSFEFHFGEAGDIFSQFFGNSPFGSGFNPFQREKFKENLDINLSTTINLKQIYNNETLILKYKKFVSCVDCKGTGFDKESHSENCDVCDGTGIYNGRTCDYCRGEGKIYTGQCKTCKGEKIILKDSEVNIQSVSQVRNSVRNVYRGYGHQSKYYKDKNGSLILTINIDRNDSYEIINNFDLSKTVDIHFQDAIDGNNLLFNHIDDTILKVKLPLKTKNNDIIKIKEKGLLKNDNSRGDLYLKNNIIIDYDRI